MKAPLLLTGKRYEFPEKIDRGDGAHNFAVPVEHGGSRYLLLQHQFIGFSNGIITGTVKATCGTVNLFIISTSDWAFESIVPSLFTKCCQIQAEL